MANDSTGNDPMPLTPYDEYPVHQTPYPLSYIPVTDHIWDEGYYFGVFNPDEKVFCGTGFRINPNTDMIGGYSFINVNGKQFTVRYSRCWRREFATHIGPFRMEIVEPLRKIRLVLEKNDSGMEFDLLWEGASPPLLEDHHIAYNRGRRTTDQTRYSQPGRGRGRIVLGDRVFQVTPDTWGGCRDHSWGLYVERAPLGPDPALLPPRIVEGGPQRAMHLWTGFCTGPYSGFYLFNETEDGVQCKMADLFGEPFHGRLYRGWSDEVIELASGRANLELHPGTRMLKRAVITLEDTAGGKWIQEVVPAAPPWMHNTFGYTPGSWKDGGTFHTYHGSEELALEWDEFDFSNPPHFYTPYRIPIANARDGLNTGQDDYSKPVHGVEYLGRVKTTAPDGSVHHGSSQFEFYINGPYKPCGLK